MRSGEMRCSRSRWGWVAAAVATWAIVSTAAERRTPAFPGAEGFGMYAEGGRRGRALFVTSLDDYDPDGEEPIPGTMRWACSQPLPRTVLFRVGGTIRLKNVLRIQEPYLTIAGQTAPGGILLRDFKTEVRGKQDGEPVHDIVIRHVRFRLGPGTNPDGTTVACREDPGYHGPDDTFAVKNAHDVIIDHCSFSWSHDETVSITGGREYGGATTNITVQWSLIAEPLSEGWHSYEHSKAVMLVGATVSFHHNVIMHSVARNPLIAGLTEPDGPSPVVDVVNNLTYNLRDENAVLYDYPADRNPASRINYVGNLNIKGPSTDMRLCPARRAIWLMHKLHAETKVQQNASLFAKDNLGINRTDPKQSDLASICWGAGSGSISPRRFPAPPVTTHSPEELCGLLLPEVGATHPKRDVVDLRLIRDIEKRTGLIISHPEVHADEPGHDADGYPVMAGGTPPADSDRDGMPDEWEREHRFAPTSPSDAVLDPDGDGYTNLEEFLNRTDPDRPDAVAGNDALVPARERRGPSP
ncbi:polysaccharide lyase family 1 protein [Verrucomicrobiota bacterium]